MKHFITITLARADQGARIAVIAGAALMIVIVSVQVVMRYVFNESLDWADEVSRLAFVTTIFLAIPLGITDGTHVGIEMLVSRFPERIHAFTLRIMSLLAAGMMMVVCYTSIVVASVTWSERLGSLDLTSSVFFLPVAIGAAHSALHLLKMSIWAPEPAK
ncbi:MAG: TRAP transporter small permease [Thalassospira sp.]|uniref:TRAP transporter small permease n=1 Tax=Thalassospira sp. TaxID=1912094 RepID=UPI0032ED88A5